MSKDAHNAVHKIFGELLKETGRNIPSDKTIKYGLLLDGRYCPNKEVFGKDFFMDRFSYINYDKYKSFGAIIPIENIFIFDIEKNSVENISWNDFHKDCDKKD